MNTYEEQNNLEQIESRRPNENHINVVNLAVEYRSKNKRRWKILCGCEPKTVVNHNCSWNPKDGCESTSQSTKRWSSIKVCESIKKWNPKDHCEPFSHEAQKMIVNQLAKWNQKIAVNQPIRWSPMKVCESIKKWSPMMTYELMYKWNPRDVCELKTIRCL